MPHATTMFSFVGKLKTKTEDKKKFLNPSLQRKLFSKFFVERTERLGLEEHKLRKKF
jgi:hypothetical protein